MDQIFLSFVLGGVENGLIFMPASNLASFLCRGAEIGL